MKLPSVENFKLTFEPFPEEFRSLSVFELVKTLEKKGETMEERQAWIGTGLFNTPKEPLLRMTRFWVLRHNDYDNGRSNVEVHLRWSDPRETFEHALSLKNDIISEGIVGYHENSRYTRVRTGSDQTEWKQDRYSKYITVDPVELGPCVRVPLLFNQCVVMARKLDEWLRRNVELLRATIPRDADEKEALRFLDRQTGMLMEARSKLPTPEGKVPRLSHYTWERDLKRTNRIATPEHYKLYYRLKRSLDFIKEERPEPLNRPISLSSLKGLRTRWVNEIAEELTPFV